MAERPQLVLASASATRHAMLDAAGVPFRSTRPTLDEGALKEAWLRTSSQSPLEGLAASLAEAKARQVSEWEPGALVIGADQVLALGARVFSKALSRDDAKQTLRELGGRTHELHSAVALATNGEIVWRHTDTAHMTVRNFSDEWLETYLNEAGGALSRSVGAYELEGLGVQLFDGVEGNHFTILGLPLLPLLAELRRRGVLPG